jgi:hypothetical protein
MCTFNLTFRKSVFCPQNGLIWSLWLLVEPTIITLHGTDTSFAVVGKGKEKVFCEAAVRFKICSNNSYFSDVGYKYIFLLFLLNYGWYQCFHIAFYLLGKPLCITKLFTSYMISQNVRDEFNFAVFLSSLSCACVYFTKRKMTLLP